MSTAHSAPEYVITAGLPTELVRGEEQPFLDRLLPLVRRGSVVVDFARVERIDAAGIAALITVYSDACKAGTRFTLIHAAPRIREILTLVGIHGFLLQPESDPQTAIDPCGAPTPRAASELVPSAA